MSIPQICLNNGHVLCWTAPLLRTVRQVTTSERLSYLFIFCKPLACTQRGMLTQSYACSAFTASALIKLSLWTFLLCLINDQRRQRCINAAPDYWIKGTEIKHQPAVWKVLTVKAFTLFFMEGQRHKEQRRVRNMTVISWKTLNLAFNHKSIKKKAPI